MKKIPAWALSLLFFLFLAAVPSAAIITRGYSVGPAPGRAVAGPPQDPVPISFWDLMPREMLLAVALTLFPLLVYPVELLFLVKIFLVLGYRKVEQYALSFNQNRQKICETIKANPGVRFNVLERMTAIKEGTLKYHLLMLIAKRRIVAFGNGGSIRYFENNGRYSDLEKKVILHLRDPTSRRILAILSSSPYVSRKEIARTVGIAGPSVSWHTKKLAEDGIITTKREGKLVRYILCPAGAEIFTRYFGQDAGMAIGCVATGEEPGE
jgi:predicted transcriptional regulator